MMNQQSSQLLNSVKGIGLVQSPGVSNQNSMHGGFSAQSLTDDPNLQAASRQIQAQMAMRQQQPGAPTSISTQQLLEQQANAQGGSAVLSPNEEMVSAVEQIRQRHQSEYQQQEAMQAHQSTPIELVKDITLSENTTEFLLLSLQRCFNMKPLQVQQLLTGQNQLLMQACEQGLPIDDFQKPSFWFEFLSQETIFNKMISQFRQAISENQEIEVILILSAIKSGLYSRDETTARHAVQLMVKIRSRFANDSSVGPKALTVFANWFTKIVQQPEESFLHNSVLQSAAECLEQHHSLVSEIAELLYGVFTTEPLNLAMLPKLLKIAYEDDIFMMYETMNSLLGELNKIGREPTKKALEDSTLIQDALIDATNNHGDFAIKLKTMNLLIEIWFLYPTIVSQTTKQHMGVGSLSLKDSFHFVLQQGLQERDKVFRINIFSIGFTLLDRLALKDNLETSGVYKTLIGGLIEHYRNKNSDKQIDQVATEMIMRGFKRVFNEHEDVPKQLLLDPFLDQLITNLDQHQTGENLMTTSELDFLTDHVKCHVKVLQEDTVQLLLQYFHAVSMSRPYLSHAMKLNEHVGEIVREHKDSFEVMRFMQQTIVPQTLNAFINIKREEVTRAAQSPLNAINAKKGRSPVKGSKGHKLLLGKEKELAADRRLKRFNLVSILDKLYQVLNGNRQQDDLVDQVKKAHHQYKEILKTTSGGLTHLLSKWGIMVDPGRHNNSLVPTDQPSEETTGTSMIVAYQENMAIEERKKNQDKRKLKELEWSKVKEPTNPIALRAVEQYQAAKQKRIEKQNQERLDVAKKKQKQERLNSQAKLEVAKRGLILERDSIVRQQKLKAIFGQKESSQLDSRFTPGLEELEPSSVMAQQIGPQRSISLANIKVSQRELGHLPIRASSIATTTRKKKSILVDFAGTEEDREKDSVRLVLQKYTTLFRFLFDKYTSKQDSIRRNVPKGRQSNEKIIPIVDLMKMFREHNMDHAMLSKHEFQLLMTQINEKLLKPYDDDALNFPGFVQFFWQSSIYCHNQGRFKVPHETGGKTLKQLLLGEMIQNLVTWFKLAARSRGHQTVLYDYPELAADPQRAKQLQQLNEKVKTVPNLTLPPGFVLSKELHQVRDYNIPPSARKVLGESKSMALELIDELLQKSLAMRLLEPQIVMSETQVVKIAIQHKSNGDITARSGASSSMASLNARTAESQILSALVNDPFGTPKSTLQHKKQSLLPPSHGSSMKDKRTSVRSTAQISTLQSILENRDFDDVDAFGLADMTESRNYHSEQANREDLPALEKYRTENILTIVAENKKKESIESAQFVGRHRASNLAPSVTAQPRYLSQVRSVKQLNSQKLKISRMHRLQENLLLQTDLTADLKAATYEYQLSKTDEFQLEPIRQTALVMEDMLRVVTGDLPKYPYQPKKAPGKGLQTQTQEQKRALSVQMKNKQVQIKQRMGPGERKSQLQKMREESKNKQETVEQSEREKKDMERIKRSIMLKKKIAVSHQISREDLITVGRAQSEKAKGINNFNSIATDDDALSNVFGSIDVVDPSNNEIDKKKLMQLRAKQLQLSQAEREARRKKQAEDGYALIAREKEDKKKAALDARSKIQHSIKRQEHAQHEQSQQKVQTFEERQAALELAAKKKAAIKQSVERLARPVVQKPLPLPEVKMVDKKVKNAFKAQQKSSKVQHERQKMEVYIKKERQDVLAFYLRPDVQVIMTEYEAHFGILYEKIVGAIDSLDRDFKRMNLAGYLKGFAVSADLIPQVFERRDMELIFDTIVNERIDDGNDFADPALTQANQTLSYEEFKKSLVRIASISQVSTVKRRMDTYEIEDEQQRLLETSGGEAPAEWDEHGNPVKYKTIITLKKKDVPPPSPKKQQNAPTKLYDISKLKLEKFHQVVHYIWQSIKDKVITYTQPLTSDMDDLEPPTILSNEPNLDLAGLAGRVVEPVIHDQMPAAVNFERNVQGVFAQGISSAEDAHQAKNDFLGQGEDFLTKQKDSYQAQGDDLMGPGEDFLSKKKDSYLNKGGDFLDQGNDLLTQKKDSYLDQGNNFLSKNKQEYLDESKIPVRPDFDEDDLDLEERKQELINSKQIEGSAAMDLTLGDSKLNKNNESLRNNLGENAYLGTSLGAQISDGNAQFKNNTMSSRKLDSDGQFSEYNEVLKSPLLEAPKLNNTRGQVNTSLHDAANSSSGLPDISQRAREPVKNTIQEVNLEQKQDEIEDTYGNDEFNLPTDSIHQAAGAFERKASQLVSNNGGIEDTYGNDSFE